MISKVTVFHKTNTPLTDDEKKKVSKSFRQGFKNLFGVLPVVVFLSGEVAQFDSCVRVMMVHDDGRVEEVRL